MGEDLPLDVFRRIAGFSTNSRTILDLWNMNEITKHEVSKEIAKLSKKSPIRLDVRRFYREANPFVMGFCEVGNKEHRKKFHDAIRELARLLERLLAISPRFQIDHLTPAALGFQPEIDENYLERAPFMLQKKLVAILSQFQSPEIAISTLFMRPSRQIRTFRNRFDTITSLNLGTMKSLKACHLRSTVFPALVNLDKLTWHRAKYRILDQLPNRRNMTSLNVTFHIIGRADWREFEFLTEFESLEHFYCGFTVPDKPSRMHMDVLLNLYQSMWQLKFPNGRRLMQSFANIRELGFWNSPEKVFKHLHLCKLANLKTLNFGAASQNLRRLCSFDSILQSFFKFDELENAIEMADFEHLNMNLHAMPAVGLDYYLPQLMDHVNRIESLKTVSLLVNCIFHSQMTSSWSLESQKEKSRRTRLRSQYTHFKMHIQGLCGLEDLNRQLPITLESCAISLNLPAENGQKVLESILNFIRKLGDLNSFPELTELHIQIQGLKCFELLVHTIHESLGPHLSSLSILAPPMNPEKAAAKTLLRQFPDFFPKLQKLCISIEFLDILMKKEHKEHRNWQEKIRKLGRKSGFSMEKLMLTTARTLQNEHGDGLFGDFVPKGEEPAEYQEEYQDDDLEVGKEEEEEDEDDDTVDHEEDEKTIYESEPDELEMLEQKLRKESEKRHAKWEKKRRNVMVDDSEDENKDPDENEEDDVIDWDQLDEMSDHQEGEEQRGRNDLFDDEAEEGEESEVEEEEEPEGEDLVDSDDDRLFINGPSSSRKRRLEQKEQNSKRRKIVVSDDDEDD